MREEGDGEGEDEFEGVSDLYRFDGKGEKGATVWEGDEEEGRR